MFVFSNRRLGPSSELLVSDDVARAILQATAEAARADARARWELELVEWLERRAIGLARADRCDGARIPYGLLEDGARALDVADIAWTPDHFERQRRFLIDAIDRARHGEHGPAFARWRRLIDAHPADSVQVGRRWQWNATG